MKLKNILLITSTVLFIILSSCQKLDHIEPINQLVEDNVIRDEKSANALLNRIYTTTRNSNITNISAAIGYYGVEQEMIRGLWGATTDFSTNNVQDNSTLLGFLYQDCYFLINNTNFLIDQLEAGNAKGLDEGRKNEMLAEAKTFRALSHFYLLRIFGQFYNPDSEYGIVVSTKPIKGVEELPRNTVKETYDAIVADLEFAVQNAPSGKDRIYVNSIFSKAFLAKVQLYKGDYTNAATNALAVIENTEGFALETDYGDIFQKRWNSTEMLFAPFVDGFDESDAYTTTAFGRYVASPSTYFRTIADNSDGVPGDGDAVGNSSGYDNRFLYAYNPATAGLNGNGKYLYTSYSPDKDQGNTYYYMRLAEVYLIYAEAEARRPGGDLNNALEKLNDIRNRAGVPTKTFVDKTALLKDIREEKMLELFCETGEPWYDLVRYDRLGEASASDLKATISGENKLIFLIPATALSGNALLVQNPQ